MAHMKLFNVALFLFVIGFNEKLFAYGYFCSDVFSSLNLKSKTFNVERVLYTYEQSIIDGETRRLLDAGLSLQAIRKDQAEFYEYYRKFPKWLEEYSSKNDRISDARLGELITRFVPRYREVANIFLLRSRGEIVSTTTLSEIIKVNQIILTHVLSNPKLLINSRSRIQDLPSEWVGSSELRTAILIQLKLQNKEVNVENVKSLFETMLPMTINKSDWKLLDQIVLTGDGKISYVEALTKLEKIRTKVRALQLETLESSNIFKLQIYHPELRLDQIVDIYQQIKSEILLKKWPIKEDQNVKAASYNYSLLYLNEKLLAPQGRTQTYNPSNDHGVVQLIQWQYQRLFMDSKNNGPVWLRTQYLESLL